MILSGSAALVYEVVWSRQLSVFLGITIRAEAVVLAAFMIGLTLGSRYLGTLADKAGRPLALFAGLESAIGAYGLVSAFLLPALAPWYARIASPLELSTASGDLTRFAVAAVALLLPTFLMGGTIPALVRGLLEREETGESSVGAVVGRVYALNTLGAALGAFAAGFLLLPALGTTWTLLAAAAINLLVAIAAGLASRGESGGATPADRGARSEAADPSVRPDRQATLIGFGIFGAAALAIQLGWVQALSQILGSSVYAFALTLSGYLAGLALGGFAFTLWTTRRRPPPALGAWIATAAGVAVVLGLVGFDRLPRLFLMAFRWNLETRLGWLVAFSFLVAWCLMLVPTTLFGFLSPLLANDCARRRSVGRDVGAAYAVNTAGTTAGVMFAGFWLLPQVGLQNTLLLGSLGLVVCGSVLLLARRPRPGRARAKAFVLSAVFLAAIALAPRWDPALTTSGPFINASRILDLPDGEDFRAAMRDRNRVLYYAESAVGSVSVRDVGADRLLVINGKTDGSRLGDRRTQLALGHLPALLHPEPEEVLVVGFGTGMTPAAVSAHPEVRRIDVIEISPEVIEASRYFAAENRSVLFDPRLRLHDADARNFLLASPDHWDLIISEPSNPWIRGVANLFTLEYFELARGHLAPGGVMGQWFQSYGMSSDDLRSIVRTFTDVFAYVTVWSPQPGDLILVGSEAPHAFEASRLLRIERLPEIAQDLDAAGWQGADSFVRMLLQDAATSATFGKEVPANTDERPRVEFNAPRHLYRETTFDNLLGLIEHASERQAVAPLAGSLDPESGGIGRTGPGVPATIVPEVRVRWSALRSADPTPLPTLVVNLRTVVRVWTRAGEVEVEVLREAESLDRTRLEERIESLTEGPIESWAAGGLTDGTPVLVGRTRDGSEAGLAWGCPSWQESRRLYVAVAAPEVVDRVMETVLCVDG
ncbi:MAG: spermidine synthase [Thermoanaerobaculia bacterium]